ncbi:hypothetical protein DFQ27_003841 [Actinomortierella ambigua]|uniref:GTP:AMP phosphotransferase, mitochondrial n=1 Tax=Actinomortierella ambigua TaxID=1343610 RepID=A0A9P6Q676_9FUNG|nr:hypothetical protein DFQ27_003841 [Actinomortierella ambigua]
MNVLSIGRVGSRTTSQSLRRQRSTTLTSNASATSTFSPDASPRSAAISLTAARRFLHAKHGGNTLPPSTSPSLIKPSQLRTSMHTPVSSSARSLFNSSATLKMARPVEGQPPLRLLLIGSPGAGKGTQSTRIQDDFEVNTISSGDLLRRNIAMNTEVGQIAAKQMKNGAFVSDTVMVKLIDSELHKLGAQQHWLLDGFPRTMSQAKSLDDMLVKVQQPLNLVIHLNVPEEVILQRIMDRWVHIPSGRVYNMTYNPPKVPGLDDITGEKLERRPDDNPETFKIRLQKHHESTEPLLDYYRQKQILITLSGNTSDEIYPQIHDLLVSRFVPDVEDATTVEEPRRIQQE